MLPMNGEPLANPYKMRHDGWRQEGAGNEEGTIFLKQPGT